MIRLSPLIARIIPDYCLIAPEGSVLLQTGVSLYQFGTARDTKPVVTVDEDIDIAAPSAIESRELRCLDEK